MIKNQELGVPKGTDKSDSHTLVSVNSVVAETIQCDYNLCCSQGGHMIVEDYHKVPAEEVTLTGAEAVTIRWLLGKNSPAPNFYLRLFEVQPGGHSPCHTHAIEHEIFVLEGQGRINAKGTQHAVSAGSFALVQPNEEHQFENTGKTVFKFLCVIPREQ
jgi:quercetin dioxygenase-like cupin family protein